MIVRGGSRGSESLGGYDDRRDGPSLIHSRALQMSCTGYYVLWSIITRGIIPIELTCMEGLALEWGLEMRGYGLIALRNTVWTMKWPKTVCLGISQHH